MEIKHDKEQNKFYLIKEGKEAHIKYSLQGNDTINLFHTFVPPELRNQGLAEKVTRAALEYAKENNLKVIPSCSYVVYFINRNKEYKELTAG